MDLQLAIRQEDSFTAVAVKGEIDNDTAPQLTGAVLAALDARPQQLVIDLSETDFLDSSGLGALVGAGKAAHRADARLAIVCPRPHLRRLFEISRLSEVLRLADTVEQALAS